MAPQERQKSNFLQFRSRLEQAPSQGCAAVSISRSWPIPPAQRVREEAGGRKRVLDGLARPGTSAMTYRTSLPPCYGLDCFLPEIQAPKSEPPVP